MTAKIQIDKEEFTYLIEYGYTNKQLSEYFGCSISVVSSRKVSWSLQDYKLNKKIKISSVITQDQLKKLLHYDKTTGEFTWKITIGSIIIGDIAGTVDKYGYICITINNKKYLAHRLAFLYVNGKLPPKDKDVDHINHIRDYNIWNNLRIVSKRENMLNKSLRRNNTSGQSGIYYRKDKKIWVVDIINPKDGTNPRKSFKNKQKAIAVAKAMYIFYEYHENHGKEPIKDYYKGSRQERINNQTPKNADIELIKIIYENTPKGYQVDHTQPLSKGGLHEPSNLQYLTEQENRSKGNKYPYECKTAIQPEDII